MVLEVRVVFKSKENILMYSAIEDLTICSSVAVFMCSFNLAETSPFCSANLREA